MVRLAILTPSGWLIIFFQLSKTHSSSGLNITKSAVSQALCGLVLKRFVTKQINQDDKKVFYIKPTKKGKEIKESIFQQNEVQYKELLEKMSIDEIVQMCSLIDKFNSILDDFSKSREDLC